MGYLMRWSYEREFCVSAGYDYMDKGLCVVVGKMDNGDDFYYTVPKEMVGNERTEYNRWEVKNTVLSYDRVWGKPWRKQTD